MLDRKTSEHPFPRASPRRTPVISSAARLNEVILQSPSTVKTPSEMLSRMASVGEAGGRTDRFFPAVFFISRGVFILVILLTIGDHPFQVNSSISERVVPAYDPISAGTNQENISDISIIIFCLSIF